MDDTDGDSGVTAKGGDVFGTDRGPYNKRGEWQPKGGELYFHSHLTDQVFIPEDDDGIQDVLDDKEFIKQLEKDVIEIPRLRKKYGIQPLALAEDAPEIVKYYAERARDAKIGTAAVSSRVDQIVITSDGTPKLRRAGMKGVEDLPS